MEIQPASGSGFRSLGRPLSRGDGDVVPSRPDLAPFGMGKHFSSPKPSEPEPCVFSGPASRTSLIVEEILWLLFFS